MTRYLPIRKEEFDLRSHVESSGHSVDTCYQVLLAEKMCKGYLVKMGGKIKSWKRRWFVFDRLKRTFSYYVGKIHRGAGRPRWNLIGCDGVITPPPTGARFDWSVKCGGAASKSRFEFPSEPRHRGNEL